MWLSSAGRTYKDKRFESERVCKEYDQGSWENVLEFNGDPEAAWFVVGWAECRCLGRTRETGRFLRTWARSVDQLTWAGKSKCGMLECYTEGSVVRQRTKCDRDWD